MSEEHLVYRAIDWHSIADDLSPVEPFTRHLKEKAYATANRHGPDHAFGETLAPSKALDIKKIAHLKDIHQCASPAHGPDAGEWSLASGVSYSAGRYEEQERRG